MAVQKTLDYGFVGFEVPQIPRAARSARVKRRGPFRKQIDDNPMCAFDLLATVAGNLLQEKESLGSSNDVKKEPHSEDTAFIGKVDKVPFLSEIVSQAPTSSGLASVVTSSDCSEKIEDLKSAKNRILLGSFANKVENTCDYPLDGATKVEAPKTENASIGTKNDMYSSDIRFVSDMKLPLCNEHITRDDVKLVVRDDDENSSRFTKFDPGLKSFKTSPRVGDRRVRKLLASNYWKVTSKSKEVANYKTDSEMKPAYQYRKNCHKRHRSQRDYPLKKRRLYRCTSSDFDGEINDDDVVNSPRKEFGFDASNVGAKVNGGSGISACVAGQPAPLQCRDSYVKLRIKSFKVPELFIEVPENATIGNLKRRVMEDVTALLGGGLRVGVLVQGKKIRDDNRTLLQTGLSSVDVLEDLGFSLEPNSCQSSSAFQLEDGPSLLSHDSLLQLGRYPASPRGVCSAVQPKKVGANLGNFIESDHDSAPSPPELSPNKKIMDSRAIVPVETEALSMVPSKKSNRSSDAAQRRIRRPFSVNEVEALVQAVEKLGTGRWRDVKMRSFDNAKHRTYVDLKDKWKTLVHTARISPQQRRGEPVPQDLLDRVLMAHAYWSQQQVKQQLKHHSETRLLL